MYQVPSLSQWHACHPLEGIHLHTVYNNIILTSTERRRGT